MICVYIATNRNTKKQYVGQTINFDRRLNEHLRSTRNYYFENALRRHGVESFDFVKIEYPESELGYWEAFWISELNTIHPTGYNLTTGGYVGRPSSVTRQKMSESHKKVIRTEEWNKKIGEGQLGEKNHQFGKKHTEESKQKMKEHHFDKTGFKHTKESIAKMISKRIGFKHSDETKKKMSETHKRIGLTEQHRQAVIEGNKKFKKSKSRTEREVRNEFASSGSQGISSSG
jgi:group I intron endonuclease